MLSQISELAKVTSSLEKYMSISKYLEGKQQQWILILSLSPLESLNFDQVPSTRPEVPPVDQI